MLLNICSLKKPGAVDVLHSYARERIIDILCVVDTWFDERVSDAELSAMGRYAVFRRDRGIRGGGVLILVDKRLWCTLLEQTFSSELLCADIHCEENAFRLMTAYSAGTGSAEAGLSEMTTLISDMDVACNTDLPLLIVGDFNCPNLDWTTPSALGGSPREKLFFDFVILNDFEQKVLRPTRPRS